MYRQHPHRSLWSVDELSAPDARAMLALAQALKRADGAHASLHGRHIAVLCEDAGGASADAVAAAAAALGAQVARIRPSALRLSATDDLREGARYLGRFYQAIACDGLSRPQMERLAEWSQLPVCNDVAAAGHPTHLLADLMTMAETSRKPIGELTLCIVGDAASSLVEGWQRLASLTGLGLCRCDSHAALHDTHASGDFLCDVGAPAGVGGHPALAVKASRHGVQPLVTQQVSNHRFMIQALLSSTLD
jgi:ornithine carbamoyltransferase